MPVFLYALSVIYFSIMMHIRGNNDFVSDAREEDFCAFQSRLHRRRRRRTQRSHTNMIIHIFPIIIILTTGWSYRGACEDHGWLFGRGSYTKFGFTPSRRLDLDKARQSTGCREHVIICIYLKIFTSRNKRDSCSFVWSLSLQRSKRQGCFCEKINFMRLIIHKMYVLF